MPFWGNMSGTNGEVTIPSIGAVVGTIIHWTLRREESGSAGQRPMTLRASFSYVNELLLMEDSVEKEILLTIRKDKHYRVIGKRMAFVDQVLTLEDCTLWQPENLETSTR
jgi:hypothetical protein